MPANARRPPGLGWRPLRAQTKFNGDATASKAARIRRAIGMAADQRHNKMLKMCRHNNAPGPVFRARLRKRLDGRAVMEKRMRHGQVRPPEACGVRSRPD